MLICNRRFLVFNLRNLFISCPTFCRAFFISTLNSDLTNTLRYSVVNFSNLSINANADAYIDIKAPSGYSILSASSSITGSYNSWVISHFDSRSNRYYFHNTASKATSALSGTIVLLLK